MCLEVFLTSASLRRRKGPPKPKESPADPVKRLVLEHNRAENCHLPIQEEALQDPANTKNASKAFCQVLHSPL